MTGDLYTRAARFGASTIHEAAGKIGALPSAIKPMAPGFQVSGPAFTVQGPPADNLWLHRAIAAAPAGAVLVASVGGVFEAGYWGEIMSTAAKVRGLTGLVIDGCVRDGDLLGAIGFPVFARGLCMRGTGKDFGARGRLGEPILIGDVAIATGDLLRGDADGVVAIPAALAEAAVAASAEREAKEAAIIERLKAGETTLAVYGWPG
ncbi:MAG: RraA family protein [Thalassobaculales bacterium]